MFSSETITELALPFMVFCGAALQSAGGIGFGLIAGPILVAALGPVIGIQSSIMLNIVVALAVWALQRKYVRYDLILPMLPGVLIGVAFGVPIAMYSPGWAIKLVMCISMGWVCFLPRAAKAHTNGTTLKYSLASGVMGGAAAIPGPAAAVYLRNITSGGRTLSGSMMPILVIAYLLTGSALYAYSGVDETALHILKSMGPAAGAGVFMGLLLARRLSKRGLNRVTQVILVATLASLVSSMVSEFSKIL